VKSGCQHGALAEIPIPNLTAEDQRVIGNPYSQAIADIEVIAAEDRLAATCDRILAEAVGLVIPDLPSGRVAEQIVRLQDIASAPATPADNRWHGVTN
jgi:phage tail protein X